MTCRATRGYTLVGMLMLVAVLGIVATATVTLGALMQRRWAEEELLLRGAEIAGAIQRYYEATPPGQRRYPMALEDLVRDPRSPGVRRYLRDIPIDPTTGAPDWQLVMAPEGGIMGVHSVSTGRPLKVAEFEPQWAHLAGAERYADWSFCHPSCIVMRPQ